MSFNFFEPFFGDYCLRDSVNLYVLVSLVSLAQFYEFDSKIIGAAQAVRTESGGLNVDFTNRFA